MKKVLLIACLAGMTAFAACNGSSSNTSSEAGQTMDSLVDEATSAVQNTADSAGQAIQNVADSAQSKIDSAVDSH